MNIQIFGKSKCFDTKKAERFFKERRIKYQYIDLPRYGISAGELKSVKAAVGGWEKLVEDETTRNELKYYSEGAIDSKLLDSPGMLKTPIVRNGKKATVGYEPEVWSEWE